MSTETESDALTAKPGDAARRAARDALKRAEEAQEQAEAAAIELRRIEEQEAQDRAEQLSEAEAEADRAQTAAAAAIRRVAELRRGSADVKSTDGTDNPSAEASDDQTSEDSTAESEKTSSPLTRRARLRSAARRVVSWSVLGFAVGMLLLVALIGGISAMLINSHNIAARDQRAAEMTSAATQTVINITSLDHNNAKRDVGRIVESTTGAFHDDFQKRAEGFASVVADSKVTSVGSIDATAVDTISDDHGDIIVAATSRVTNAAGAEQEPRSWRLRVTVEKDGDQYKVSNVDYVA